MSASDLLQKVQLGVSSAKQSVANGVGQATDFIRKNPVTSGATLAGAGLAGGVVVTQIIKKRKSAKKKTTTKKKTTRKKTKKATKKRKTSAKQKKPYTAGRGRDTSTRRIRYTKNNQPYVILKSGKARFIKKSSVSRARKRKGGRY